MGERKKGRIFYKTARLMTGQKRILVTTGDPAGIGLKAAFKALARFKPKKNLQFLIWTSREAQALTSPHFKTLIFKEEAPALKSPFAEDKILQIKSLKKPLDWLTASAKLCLKGQAQALVTGPVRKRLLSGAVGQTALLQSLCGAKHVFMCFRGKKFNVILLTDHIPLKKLAIQPSALRVCLDMALRHRVFLQPRFQNQPLGVLGLNPHAGEQGLIGREEESLIKPLLKEFPKKEICGPLPPDSAFLQKKLYSFFIALYHDQGLIPFKMAHARSGFVQTLGLPFLRLGVDHGTALGLKEKEISSESFFSALKEAARLAFLPLA